MNRPEKLSKYGKTFTPSDPIYYKYIFESDWWLEDKKILHVKNKEDIKFDRM